MKHLFLLSMLMLGSAAWAHGTQDQTARNLAATCANCHGTNGQSHGAVASLAGQKAADTMAKLAQFKSGERPATIMHQIAKGFSESQLQAIAEYFAQQK